MRSHYLLAYALAGPALIRAQSVSLGTAASFGVLGATTVTNTGLTVINGNLGVSPGTAITGFPPGIVSGSTNSANAVAAAAQADALKAYNAAAGLASTSDLTGQDLGGLTLGPGVYKFASSAQLTGTLTLDAGGNPNAQFIFQIGSTITTASASMVSLINGANACNVIFQVGSSATLGTGTKFMGVILANTAITVTTGVSNTGALVALNAAVTLDTNAINACTPTSVTSSSSSASVTVTSTIISIRTVSSSTGSAASTTSSTSSSTSTAPTSTIISTRTVSSSTGSAASTTSSTSSSNSTAPTSTSICVPPTGKPVGGIGPPVCGCNDIWSDWVKKPFKLYTSKKSSDCPTYSRNDVVKACKDGCDTQYNSCVSIYAESCKGKSQTKTTDSYASAMSKCKEQREDCKGLNNKHDDKKECSSFGIKFRT